MPFYKNDGLLEARSRGGKKGKRPGTIRTKSLSFRITPDEMQMIDDKAKTANLSRVELVVRAVREYKP